MDRPLITPAWGFPIFEEADFGLVPTNEMHQWMLQVTAAINTAPPMTGVGSPEGVIAAKAGRWYVDTDIATIWYKQSGDGEAGWLLTI